MYAPIRPDVPQEVAFYRDYFATPVEACPSYLYASTAERETDIYVITFNNLFLVEYQVKTLRRFFHSPFHLIVVDNNNGLHEEVSRQLLQLCIDEGVTYLKAPDNFYQHEPHFDPSMKLGTTMNWLYQQCVKIRRPKYFGYLDQDCFLVRDLDMGPRLDRQGMFGRAYRSLKVPEAWTLHVTTIFFRLDFVQDCELDFRASHKYEMDTGSANYDVLYRRLRYEDYVIEQAAHRFDARDVNRPGSVQHYELMAGGEWYHMCASSHDQLAGDGQFKLAYTKGYLDSRLLL